MTYEIEDGIPLPPRTRSPRAGTKPDPNSFIGTLRRLKVGQSVFVPRTQKWATGAVSAAKKTTGQTYSVRTVEGGCRVWRVS